MSSVIRQKVVGGLVVAFLLCALGTEAGTPAGVDSDASGLKITKAPVAKPARVRPLAGRLAVDLLDLAKVPAQANRRQWGKFALGLGLIGAIGQSDERLRSSLDPEVHSGLARKIRPVGQEGGLLFLGASLALGHLADKPRAMAIGRDGIEATVLAAGVVAPLLKRLVGRQRPRDEFGFGALRSSSGESFPSGEVTQVFAIASVVSAHSEKKWVKGAAWLVAGATAWQRMELDAHWGSDVVGGALIGAGIGRWVVRRNRERYWSIEPRLGGGSVGVALRRSY